MQASTDKRGRLACSITLLSVDASATLLSVDASATRVEIPSSLRIGGLCTIHASAALQYSVDYSLIIQFPVSSVRSVLDPTHRKIPHLPAARSSSI